MSSSHSVTWGAACAIAIAAGIGAASAQDRRIWVDPPAGLGRNERPEPTQAQPAPRASPAGEDAGGKSAVAPAASAEPARPIAAAPAPRVKSRAATVRRAAKARTAQPARQVKARPPRTRVAREAVPRADGPVSLAGRPLELMTLQTIELEDGRRYQVLIPGGP